MDPVAQRLQQRLTRPDQSTTDRDPRGRDQGRVEDERVDQGRQRVVPDLRGVRVTGREQLEHLAGAVHGPSGAGAVPPGQGGGGGDGLEAAPLAAGAELGGVAVDEAGVAELTGVPVAADQRAVDHHRRGDAGAEREEDRVRGADQGALAEFGVPAGPDVVGEHDRYVLADRGLQLGEDRRTDPGQVLGADGAGRGVDDAGYDDADRAHPVAVGGRLLAEFDDGFQQRVEHGAAPGLPGRRPGLAVQHGTVGGDQAALHPGSTEIDGNHDFTGVHGAPLCSVTRQFEHP